MIFAGDRRDIRRGCFWMALAVLIWASWLVLTSTGRATDLAILDLAALRAVVPTILLASFLWQQRHQLFRVGLGRCLLLAAYGAPFTICVGHGLSTAPVAHAAALVPGVMPVMATILGAIFLHQRVSARQIVSFVIILVAALAILTGTEGPLPGSGPRTGHFYFLFGAILWATFAVTLTATGISPYLATGIVGLVSSLGVLPFWVFSDLSNMGAAAWHDILFQTLFQGVASGLLSLFAFTQALRLLGPRANMIAALTPGAAALLAIPILGQEPTSVEVLALMLVVVGLIVSASRSTGRQPIRGTKTLAQN